MSEGCTPLVTAHSGCEGTAKNSLASVLAGLDGGADIIEVDIRSSLDVVPVLHHDPAIGGESGRSLLLSGHTYEEILAFAGSEGIALTPLETVMALIVEGGSVLNLDLKDIDCLGYINGLADTCRARDSIIISGCGPEQARQVIGLLPGVQVLLNAYYDPAIMETGRYSAFVHTLCREAIEVGSCGINIDYMMCREELVLHARRRFVPVSVWTVDDESDMQQMASYGVFSITTHHPRHLRTLLGERNW